jgi:flagellar motility protein MotE (MotC chaperone)
MNIDSNFIVIIGWVLTAIGFIIVWNKSKHEINALDMTALKNATDAIENYSKQVLKLREELNVEKTQRQAEEVVHKQEICDLNVKIERLEKIIKDKDLEIEDLRDWSERLCNQILSISQVPVAIRLRSRKKEIEVE